MAAIKVDNSPRAIADDRPRPIVARGVDISPDAVELARGSPPIGDPWVAGERASERVVNLVLEEISRRRVSPRATYRCQFHGGFGFRDAAAIVPYLDELGISHLYASPVLQARPGSIHGYDVCNHGELDAELGGRDGWNELLAALRQHGLGLVLDIVPNHMATHATNHWWTDVLENGPCSPFAKYFDIDWHPVQPELDSKVLLPVLGQQYGDVLEAGELDVEHRDGAFVLRYFDRVFPLDPQTTAPILADRLDELRTILADQPDALAEYESILTALAHLPPRAASTPAAVVERHRDKEVVKRRLRDLAVQVPSVQEFIAANVAGFNGVVGEPASFDRLEALLAAQAYRLCHWKAAGDEVNYRRFFDINELAALCTEDPDVFYHTHRLTMQLVGDGEVSGLRVDHIDGLYAPERYLWRLQWAYLAELVDRATFLGASGSGGAARDSHSSPAPADDPAQREANCRIIAELCRRLGLPLPAQEDWRAIMGAAPSSVPAPFEDLESDAGTAYPGQSEARGVPLFVVVEKILGPHEPLPESWPVHGTTGYDFLQMCDGLFVPPDGWRQLQRDYSRLTGQSSPFEDVARDSKMLILRVAMAGELQMLAHQLNHISEQHRRSRDFTLNMLRFALREILVCFPVYRIYPEPAGVSERDRHFVAQAVAQAKRRNPATDPSVFDFVREVLLLEHPPGLPAEAIREREVFAGRFQQVTSPVMAKGVEDTAFYVYFPLLSVNEVGSGPQSPSVAPGSFHVWNERRAQCYPQAMLASSTHDTKRSEDVRARLHLLAEIPRAWRSAVQRWMRLNRRRKTEVDGLPAPSRDDEYLLYQSLLGIWPQQPVDKAQREAIAQRLRDYMSKACHEAKQRTSWINPNDAYDRAVRDFVTGLLDDGRTNRFLADFQRWQTSIARLGLVNSLAELVLKLTSPGFPDLYQGQECWSFRLVDPDNRGKVDYAEHAGLLAELIRSAGTADERLALARRLASDLADSRSKLYILWRLLEMRKRLGEVFASAHYMPLRTGGTHPEHILAFARVPGPSEDEDASRQAVVVAVPRFVGRLLNLDPESAATCPLPCGAKVWGDTYIEVPGTISEPFVDVITGQRQAMASRVAVADLLAEFPVAVLVSE